MPSAPKLVQIDNAGVYIEWGDGHHSIYPHRYLRLRCRCAECIEEWTHRPLLDPEKVPAGVAVLDHLTVGAYALQFLFSDAHYTGIYTYDFLRQICACQECREKREEEGGTGGKQGR